MTRAFRAATQRIAAAALAFTAVFAVPMLLWCAKADDYPSRVVNLVVAFPPGGGVDTVGRVVARRS